MRRCAIWTLWAAVALLSACGGGSSDTTADGTTAGNTSLPGEPTCGIAGFAEQVVASLNAARAAARTCGATALPAAPPLSWNGELAQAANGHAIDMASVGFFSHTGSNGSHYLQRIADSGYPGATGSEILARTERISTSSILPVSMDAWLKSPPHCAALMRTDLQVVGAACQRGGGYAYIAVDFGG